MDLHRRVLQSSVGSALPPRPAHPGGVSLQPGGARGHRRDYSPLEWSDYFEERVEIRPDAGGDVFTAYASGKEGPVLVLLHGGGFSGLTWAVFVKNLETRVACRTLAIDLRGHGDSKCR
jgi:protein phosphatase methylesterase 1